MRGRTGPRAVRSKDSISGKRRSRVELTPSLPSLFGSVSLAALISCRCPTDGANPGAGNPSFGDAPKTRAAHIHVALTLEARRSPPAGFLFARHVLSLGDGSSLRTVMSGTARLGQGVRREAESEGSRCRSSDSTNRNWIQGRTRRVTRQWTRTPNSHPEAWAVNPARPEGKTQGLTWEVSRSVGRTDYRDGNAAGRGGRSQPRP